MGSALKEGWRFASATSGAQCVMTFGVVVMRWSSALNLASPLGVCTLCTHNHANFIVPISYTFVVIHHAFTGAVAFREAAFGSGTGPILLDDVSCVGTETELLACSNDEFGAFDCYHSEDAGVRCQGRVPHNQCH